MKLTDRELETLWLFARGAVTAIPAARELVEKLYAEVKRCHAEMAAKDEEVAKLKKELREWQTYRAGDYP